MGKIAKLTIFIAEYLTSGFFYVTIQIVKGIQGEKKMTDLGRRVSDLLKERNISQKDFALMIGVTEPALCRYLKNEREPRVEIIANMATALNTSVDYLLTGKKPETCFDEIYKLVARGAYQLTESEKMKIIQAIMENR